MFVWLERTELDRRPPEFGALDWDGEHVAMAYTNGSPALWNAWLASPPHIDVLAPLSHHRLRYAALDFDYLPNAHELASAGMKLTWIVEQLCKRVPLDATLFAKPVLYFDVQGELRVAFDDAASIPLQATPMQHMIYAIGLAVERYGGERSFELDRACERCIDGKATSLGAARELFKLAGGDVLGPSARQRPIYSIVEAGIGLVHLGKLEAAHRRFADALKRAPKSPYVRALFEATQPKSPYLRYEAPDPQRPRAIYPVNAPRHYARYDPEAQRVEWSAIVEAAAECELRRDYTAAVAMYERVSRDSVDRGVLDGRSRAATSRSATSHERSESRGACFRSRASARSS